MFCFSQTERLLAAQNPLSLGDRPHQMFADAPPTMPVKGADAGAVPALPLPGQPPPLVPPPSGVPPMGMPPFMPPPPFLPPPQGTI